MYRKKLLARITALCMAGTMAFCAAGCGQQAGATAQTGPESVEKENGGATAEGMQTKEHDGQDTSADPLGKYEEGITLTTIRGITNRTYPEGQTWDNNVWTQKFEDALGITFDYVWSCDSKEFDSKMNVAIATNDLAELMLVPYDTFYRMAKAGLLEDLSGAYETYASDEMKKRITYSDGIALEACTIDGKLYGLGSAPYYGGQLLWYRNDWAEKVGITKPPKTIDEVIDMAYKFAKEDPNSDGSSTVGFALSKEMFDGGYPIEGLFAAYNAYPTIWIEKDEGIEFGGVQDEVKDVLVKMHQWYKDGVIDNDWLNKGCWNEAFDDQIKGKIGMAFGYNWFGDWGTGKVMEAFGYDATWTCMAIPNVDGEPSKVPVQAKQNKVLCAVKGSEHPEALVKMVNLAIVAASDEGLNTMIDDEGNTIPTHFYKADLMGVPADEPYWNYYCALEVQKALETGDTSSLTPETQSYYDRCQKFLAKEDPNGYCSYSVFGPGGSMTLEYDLIQKGCNKVNAYYGANTDTMNDKWGQLQSKKLEIYSKIIVEGNADAVWQEWLDYFESQGGAEITAEVNEWYKEQN